MRGTRIISRVVLAIAALAIFAAMDGCKKHENFPTQITLVEAPAPTDFTITALPFTNGTYDYDLTWSVSDPANVDRFRLYLIGAGLVPELLAEPTGNAYSFSLPFNASGLQFGLSTVSTGSVESNMTVAIVPTLE